MAKKIYVGNLPYTVGEEELKEMFEKIGEVLSAKIITDSATNRSKGFGFVEMSSDEDADRAITTLNGTTLDQRNINVSEAKPQVNKARPGGFRPGGGGGGGKGRPSSFGGGGRGKGTERWR
ncbi:MAG: RNA-binding protein [Nitrospirae bacterium]|nr:RNA-binding protein [Nitrospirota bacterium]